VVVDVVCGDWERVSFFCILFDLYFGGFFLDSFVFYLYANTLCFHLLGVGL
jgi:hypothetical protein